ncbi:Asp23/Gls24 family envelope stress response protein [Lentzea tibetensis]|uniref:Asp23/Gls24 family envelope stress response protein n=1 Tax=Lentzea tibetensis TaxID=2591470 RepID=UPI001F28C3CC|nr:Asp23/Gls24 family envelope stress response protein [Lentzea tibetensis]
MTTTTEPSPVTSPPGADRGRLTIGARAVERIAAQAATEVDGVGGSAARMLGLAVGGEDREGAVKITAHVSGDTVVLNVRLSINYPQSITRTTERARAHLTRRVEELTGLTVLRMDIVVTALHGATAARRVQ